MHVASVGIKGFVLPDIMTQRKHQKFRSSSGCVLAILCRTEFVCVGRLLKEAGTRTREGMTLIAMDMDGAWEQVIDRYAGRVKRILQAGIGQ